MTEKVIKIPLIEELVTDIIETRTKVTLSEIREQSKRPYMYLSDVHTCYRHNYYSMVEGEKRRPVNQWLQDLFKSGHIWERETVRELMALGFDVIGAQQAVTVKYGGRDRSQHGQIIGKGKIDGMIRYKKTEFPIEIKSMNENVFNSITCVEDLFKKEYTEKYVRQLLMYLWGQGKESGLFIINDRANHWKILTIHLGNYLDYCEKILKNMEATWDARVAEKEPDRITYNHRLGGLRSLVLPQCFCAKWVKVIATNTKASSSPMPSIVFGFTFTTLRTIFAPASF